MKYLSEIFGYRYLVASGAFYAWVAFMMISGCNTQPPPVYPKYTYTIQQVVPDSSVDTRAQWIKDIVYNTNKNLTTSDYEDPEDVVQQAEYTSEHMYSKSVEGLWAKRDGTENGFFIPHTQLNEYQKNLFQKLKASAEPKEILK